MPRALEIPIEVTRIDRAVDSLRRLSGGLREVGTAQRGINAGGGGGGSGFIGITPAQIRATERIERMAEREARRNSFTYRASTLLRSTRLNFGGVSPLVGRLADAAGVPTSGAAGLMFGGMGAALAGFTTAIRQATDHLNQFGTTLRSTGGTPADVAALGRFGYTGAEGAGAAGAFRQRITTDPMAQMFAARLGVRALPEPFGTTNRAGIMRQALEQLEKMTNAEQRLRFERALGLEDAEQYIQISPQLRALRQEQARFAGSLGDSAKAANELSVATKTLGQSWEDLKATVGTGPIRELAYDIESLVDTLQKLGKGDVAGALGPGSGDPHTDAVKENTDAMKQNTSAIEGAYLPAGTYGGGVRTGKAMPTGWAGDFLNRNMEAGALSKGMPGV